MFFADDMILGETEEEVQRQLDVWASKMEEFGLTISQLKSEIKVLEERNIEKDIALRGKPLKLVNNLFIKEI